MRAASGRRQRIFQEESAKWNEQPQLDLQKLFKIFKSTDWANTPIYEHFKQYGCWVDNNNRVYTEEEIKNIMKHDSV